MNASQFLDMVLYGASFYENTNKKPKNSSSYNFNYIIYYVKYNFK